MVLPPERINTLDPKLPGPNLAIVKSLPTRRMATVHAVTPWPAQESLSETLHHEIGHAWLAPITAQMPDTEASVMLEEQLVETLGVYLASLTSSARAAARRALAPIVDSYAPRLRARILARAATRARGGEMDPNLVKQALDALEAGDGAKCAELLKGLIAAAASGGTAPTTEPPAADAGQMAPAGEATGVAATGEQPMGARAAARKEGADVSDIATMRARKTALDLAADIARMHTAALPNAKQALIVGARARLGADAISPATEARILKAPTFASAEEIIAILEESPVAMRARSGVEHAGSQPNVAETKTVAEADLLKEGFDLPWIKSYQRTAKADPVAGLAELEGGREALRARRARIATNGGGS